MHSIKNEMDYTVALVRSVIRDEPAPELAQGLSFEKVFKFAFSHSVAHIAFLGIDKLKNKPDEALYNHWKKVSERATIKHICQTLSAQEITAALKNNHIRYLEAQGTRLNKYYKKPELRAMGDIDLIIDIENLAKADEVLQSIGYTVYPNSKKNDEIDYIKKPFVFLEMHTEFFPVGDSYRPHMNTPFSYCDKNNEEEWLLSDTAFYIYSVLHLAKHFLGKGCGIRRILDIYILHNALKDSIDTEAFNKKITQAGFYDYYNRLLELAYMWFGGDKAVFPSDSLVELIYAAAAHGNEQIKMDNNFRRLRKQNKKFIKLNYVLKLIFVDKTVMYKKYPFLKKFAILFPFCYIHRLFYAMFCRREQIQKEFSFLSKTNYKKDI